jgi:membrane protease YdiL (CAAX protease family)
MLTLFPRPEESDMSAGSFGGTRDAARHRLIIALLMGIIFGACHAPNPTMMLICLVAGVFWTRIFYMTPNMLTLVLSHALLGTTISRVVCLYTRVGPFYANNDRYVFVTVLAGIQQWLAGLVKVVAR